MGRFYQAAMLLAVASAAQGAEPGSRPVPAGVARLSGCWAGRGVVMGKPVTIAVIAKPILLGAMIALDADSRAVADAGDRYAAHLTFAGAAGPAETVVGFWADSFGGDYTATGRGAGRPDGFDIAYAYPDAAFVNRWRRAGDRLTWRIVRRGAGGAETPFADYALRAAPCRPPR